MKDETYEKLFELATERKIFVTPLILDYYRLEDLGINEKGIVNLIGNKLNPILS